MAEGRIGSGRMSDLSAVIREGLSADIVADDFLIVDQWAVSS